MKKLFVTLIALAGLGFCANAEETCKIINGGGSSVEVTSCYIDDDKVKVTVSNDSNDIAANVSVTVTVTYTYGRNKKTENYTSKKRAAANAETVIEIPISKAHPNDSYYVANSVKTQSITGVKCE